MSTRVANRDAGSHIAARRPFTGSNFEGRTVSGVRYLSIGRMPSLAVTEWYATPGVDYVVYSYATPIAWHGADGWHVPAVRYSQTTDRHRGVVRRAVVAARLRDAA